MPYKALRPCRHSGCPNLTDGVYCKEHFKEIPKKKVPRASASARGYNSKWQRERKIFLNKNPLCVRCFADGKYTPATVVDHKIPHRMDENLFWDKANWQPLCKACHDRKTWAEDMKIPYRYGGSENR